jgi:hypothetical protein
MPSAIDNTFFRSRAVSTVVAMVALVVPMLFLLADAATYFAWGDEVQFVDPAASAVFGQGFTSMAWPYQTSQEFFAGNAPGYSLLLIPWFRIFGFGLEQARCLNILLAGLAGLLLLRALGRAAPGMPLGFRATAVGVSLLGYGILVSAGSARYDMLGLLVAAAIFLLLTQAPGRARRACLVLAGAAVFYAGFHLVVALCIALLLLMLQARQKYLAASTQLAIGMAAGLSSWLLVMALNGLFVKFFVMLLGSQHTISGQMAKLVLHGEKGGLERFRSLGSLATLDLSLSVFALLLVAMLFMQWRHLGARVSEPEDRHLGWLAVDLVLVVPVGLFFLGKFPVYYSWIAYVPAVLIASVWAWRRLQRGAHWPIAAWSACAFCAAAWGVHDRIHQRDIDLGDPLYSDFKAWVRGALTQDDMVYADHEAYFAARSVARRVLGPTYGQTAMVRGIPEHERVSALLVQAAHKAQATALMEGNWQTYSSFVVKGSAPGAAKLDYVLLRRAGTTMPRQSGLPEPAATSR